MGLPPRRSARITTVEVVDYDPNWQKVFEQVRSKIWPAVGDFAVGIEHVGSTSVPGLAAKPIVDLCVVVASSADVPLAIERLAEQGYVHRGNLGVEEREAFIEPDGLPRHNLYLSPKDSLSLRNHLGVRDYLRSHPDTAKAYGDLKKRLAEEFPSDIERYIDGKTDLILGILREIGLSADDLRVIERINRQVAP